MKYVVIIFLLASPLFVIPQGKIIAHRGASSIAPENTLAALYKAIESGSDCIEIDIRMSSDDSIMVIHDATIDRTTNGMGLVDQYNYEELKAYSAGYAKKFDVEYANEKIPSLFEMLFNAKGKINICIDLKNVSESPVVDLVSKMDMVADVYLMSYNIDKLLRIKEIYPFIKTILLKNTITSIDLGIARDNKLTGVSGSYLFADLLVNKAHRSGLEYWAGVVNDPAKAEKLTKHNIDAILTDYPQLMHFNREAVINVSPNPFYESIEIQLMNVNAIQQVLILNNLGSVVYEFSITDDNSLIWKPDNTLSTGIYLIYIIADKTTIIEKVLFVGP